MLPGFISSSTGTFHLFLHFLSLEKARLQAEAKAAEEFRRKAEAEAVAEAKRKREIDREAARQALLKVKVDGHPTAAADYNLFFNVNEMLLAFCRWRRQSISMRTVNLWKI